MQSPGHAYLLPLYFYKNLYGHERNLVNCRPNYVFCSENVTSMDLGFQTLHIWFCQLVILWTHSNYLQQGKRVYLGKGCLARWWFGWASLDLFSSWWNAKLTKWLGPIFNPACQNLLDWKKVFLFPATKKVSKQQSIESKGLNVETIDIS